jgi:poly [ADP-ribose] polymerase
MATIIKKGDKSVIYPIDKHFKHNGEIVTEGNNVYSCTLNQTDLKTNANKFYIMQLIHTSGSEYFLYTRWGRIGEVGRPTYNTYSNLSTSISAFEKQFKSKTGNAWQANGNFTKKPGKYYMTEVTYETNDPAALVPPVQTAQPISALDDRIQHLLGLISDVETMNRSLVELNIDPKKMPLGKISNEQLDKARELLQEIRNCVGTPNKNDKIVELSSEFYTYVPYSCGRKTPPTIDNPEILSEYNNMIDELKNIAVAVQPGWGRLVRRRLHQRTGHSPHRPTETPRESSGNSRVSKSRRLYSGQR